MLLNVRRSAVPVIRLMTVEAVAHKDQGWSRQLFQPDIYWRLLMESCFVKELWLFISTYMPISISQSHITCEACFSNTDEKRWRRCTPLQWQLAESFPTFMVQQRLQSSREYNSFSYNPHSTVRCEMWWRRASRLVLEPVDRSTANWTCDLVACLSLSCWAAYGLFLADRNEYLAGTFQRTDVGHLHRYELPLRTVTPHLNTPHAVVSTTTPEHLQ